MAVGKPFFLVEKVMSSAYLVYEQPFLLANFDKEYKEYKEYITRINVPIYRKINLISDLIALLSLIKLFKKNKCK